jgi:hypothetical protein
MPGVNRPVRCELVEGIAAPAHEAESARLVSDLKLGKVAPPALGGVDLIALALAGRRQHQHFDLIRVAAEAGSRQAGDQPPAGDVSGWPAKA